MKKGRSGMKRNAQASLKMGGVGKANSKDEGEGERLTFAGGENREPAMNSKKREKRT